MPKQQKPISAKTVATGAFAATVSFQAELPGKKNRLQGYKEASLRTKPEGKKIYQKNKNPTQSESSGIGTFDTKGTGWAINHGLLFIHTDSQEDM